MVRFLQLSISLSTLNTEASANLQGLGIRRIDIGSKSEFQIGCVRCCTAHALKACRGDEAANGIHHEQPCVRPNIGE